MRSFVSCLFLYTGILHFIFVVYLLSKNVRLKLFKRHSCNLYENSLLQCCSIRHIRIFSLFILDFLSIVVYMLSHS